MRLKGYIIWESVFEPYDSITCTAVANSGDVYFAGIRNSKNVVLYKYSANGYKTWSREFQDLADAENVYKIICVDDRIIGIGNTVLHSFIQTFNSGGNMIANKPLTGKITLSDIITDNRGNLIIQISTDDINVMKNLGINL